MSNEKEQTAQRHAKLNELIALGVPAYPNQFERTGDISTIVGAHGSRTAEELETERPEVRTAGRVLGMRTFGKANFLVLSDGRERIQAYVRADSVDATSLAIFSRLDFGDHI